MGPLTVKLDEGVITRIQVSSTRNAQVLRVLDKLTGHTPSASVTERQSALLSDIPRVTVNKVSFVAQGDQGVLLVDIKEARITVTLGMESYGSGLWARSARRRWGRPIARWHPATGGAPRSMGGCGRAACGRLRANSI